MTERSKLGRPKLPEGVKKQMSSFKLASDIREYLKQSDNATAAIETALRRSWDYRDWKRTQNQEN